MRSDSTQARPEPTPRRPKDPAGDDPDDCGCETPGAGSVAPSNKSGNVAPPRDTNPDEPIGRVDEAIDSDRIAP